MISGGSFSHRATPGLALRWACVLAFFSAAGEAAPVVQGIESIAMTVSDADASAAFYENVLGFVLLSDEEKTGAEVEHVNGVFGARVRVVTLKLGDEQLQLEQFLAPQGRPFPVDSHANDRWFQHVAIIVSDMDRAYALLREHKVRFGSSGPQLLPDWNKNAGGIAAFYFRDPDGHFLEVLHFPQDKGGAKWHTAAGKLFLGIDHTAIVVQDTEHSLHFYRDTLGMRVVGNSENFGTEQEHLNNVFGARLRITALHAAAGPGVELLEYLAPAGGRPMPADTQANDIWHWQINFAADVGAALGTIRAGHYAMVSPAIIAGEGLMVLDPDGHASLLKAAPH